MQIETGRAQIGAQLQIDQVTEPEGTTRKKTLREGDARTLSLSRFQMRKVIRGLLPEKRQLPQRFPDRWVCSVWFFTANG